MKSYLEIIRPLNGLIAGIGVVISTFIGLNAIRLNDITLLAFIGTFFITSAGNVANDYFDQDIDKMGKKYRAIPSGRIRAKNALIYMYILFAIGLVASSLINIYTLVLAAFNSITLFKYNEIKRNTIYGNIVIGLLTASIFIYGGLAVGDVTKLVFMGLLAGLCNIAREITKDIEDVEGDSGHKTTLSTVYGTKKSSYSAASILVICIALSLHPLITSIFSKYYLFVISLADTVFLYSAARLVYNPEKYARDIQQLIKVGMVITLFAFFVGII